MNEITQVISTLGFPVFMCLILCWYIKYSNDNHSKEVGELRKTVENNTRVLTVLCERLAINVDEGHEKEE